MFVNTLECKKGLLNVNKVFLAVNYKLDTDRVLSRSYMKILYEHINARLIISMHLIIFQKSFIVIFLWAFYTLIISTFFNLTKYDDIIFRFRSITFISLFQGLKF